MMLRKVISGGQTVVHRAALNAAIDACIPIGGYCPKGRSTISLTNKVFLSNPTR